MQIAPTGANPFVTPTASTPASTPASSPSAASGAADAGDDAVQNFLDFVGKTPAEQMRDQILRDLGVSVDDLKNMSPQDRAKLEEKIKELTKEKVQEATEKKTGVMVDMKV